MFKPKCFIIIQTQSKRRRREKTSAVRPPKPAPARRFEAHHTDPNPNNTRNRHLKSKTGDVLMNGGPGSPATGPGSPPKRLSVREGGGGPGARPLPRRLPRFSPAAASRFSLKIRPGRRALPDRPESGSAAPALGEGPGARLGPQARPDPAPPHSGSGGR